MRIHRRILQSYSIPLTLLAMAGLHACGEDPKKEAAAAPPAETPYGSVSEIGRYLQRIEPLKVKIGQLQARYESGLSSNRGDDQRLGTGQNLANLAAELEPQMKSLLESCESIEPPALLAPVHRDTKKLILLRLGAYQKTREGWHVESTEGGSFRLANDQYYRAAESQLAEANRLIQQLNREMSKIYIALEQVSAGT
ncbi:MAG: hypothetical protein VX733_00070 [Candidatus Latescibacterota bacterium]|nr:hypothetical protein [Candidatus Latescibacterota bacterium]